ncbi:hypothetical protein GAYE_SCF23G4314 [Galdieria yellowstonensis]|uniref:Uncharacterized protein n=1 Tax=Galdieria yellowstonensis TaxID=3028027 RepID=A0AAV9IGA5_9RHOD|nr:hypothetical protein GAYE_SCF23G4314 [Galdieria yellowstonensis]
MSLNELVKSEEHVTLKLFRAFLEDFSKCPMHLRGTLMSRIRVELFSVVSSASFNYLPHLFDVLVVQAEWQLLNCLISLLDWLPIGKKKLLSSMDLYQRVKKFGPSGLPWKVSRKVHKELLLCKYRAQKLHQKWKFVLNPGGFVKKTERKLIRSRVNKTISKKSNGVKGILRQRNSSSPRKLQDSPKKKVKRVSFPPDERLESVRYYCVSRSDEQNYKTSLPNDCEELAVEKSRDKVGCFVYDGEIAWFSPHQLHIDSCEQVRLEMKSCNSTFVHKRDDEHDLFKKECFYLKDFRDGTCIEIPLTVWYK